MIINLINIFVGLFFLVGSIIAIKNKNNDNLVNFSVAMAFIVLIILLLFDILPETIELLEDKSIFYMIGGIVIGLGLLLIIEKIVPNHDHFENLKEHSNHLKHIGVMTSIALIIHNIVEGMSIYSISASDLKVGIIYAFGVGLHNIPFGIEITTMLNTVKSKKSRNIYLILLTISTFLGGLLIFLFKNYLNDFILGILLSITSGMIIYLVLFELLVELKENYNKYSTLGLIIGAVLMLVGVIL